ncbi:hypothetical protein LT330_009500 [Penicillium expansum]|nr:hypothetical protein LT330_009500 [Penicillium expansum]
MDIAFSTIELKDDTIIVVLGASGDLAKKKTFPALFGLFRNKFLPKDIRIVGYARTKMDTDEYLKRVRSYIKVPTKEIEDQLDQFCKMCTYVSGQYDQDDSFINLNKHLEEIENNRQSKEQNRVFYMALPPSVFTTVSEQLKRNCYPKSGLARIIVEKPFGKDLQSSRDLQKALEPNWKEDEIFRIDHYLGKEMVKNILILRFGNEFFNATWNRRHIDNVQITFKEPFGTEGRGGYFDEFGIIRDVMQNHLLQVLTLLAMERPISFSSEDIRDEKVRVLRAMDAIEPKNVIIGQYGRSLDGSKPGYLEDDTVPKESRCPTFCAMVAYIKNERWDGVPFILKAGKALNEQKTEVRIQFKDVTSGIFKDIPRNELVIRVQPNESVYIKMNSKLPGLSMQTVVTELDLTYRRRFSDLKIPEAYESLILDAFKGDHSNFVRDDELDASWRIFTPLLHYLDDNKEIIPMEYPYGSRGPAVLDDFTASYGYKFSDAAGYQWPVTTSAPNRLPFMVFGSLVVAFCLLVLGWTAEIVGLFVKDPEKAKNGTIALAVLSIYAVDFSINVVQACCRGLIVDTLPIPSQQAGSAWAGRMSAIGQLFAYVVGAIDTVSIFGTFLGDTQFKQMTVIAALSLIGAVAVTSYSVKERVLLSARDDGSAGAIQVLSQLFKTTFELPPRIQAICWAQFWAWIGWFPFLFYSTTWVGETYFRYEVPKDDMAKATDMLGEVGRVGSLSLTVFSSITVLSSVLLPFCIMQPDTKRTRFTARPPPKVAAVLKAITAIRPDLQTAWLISHIMFAATMIFAPLANSRAFATFLVAVCGIPWAISGWAPFAFMGVEINKLTMGGYSPAIPSSRSGVTMITSASLRNNAADTELDVLRLNHHDSTDSDTDEEEQASNIPSTGELAGIYLGVLNVYTTLPQFVGTFISWIVFSILEPAAEPKSDNNSDSWMNLDKDRYNAISICLFIGAISALVAAEATRRLRYIL